MAPSGNLKWQDILELSAAVAGLARVRSRFISLGGIASLPNGLRPLDHSTTRPPDHTVALARAGLYNFLAAAFAEPPSAAFVERLYHSGVLDLLADKGLGSDDLRHWGDGLSPLERASDLAAAYTQLLTRPGPNHVSPVASEHLCPECDPAQSLSWGPAAEAAVPAYREAGLVIGGDGPSPPDHLAIELQFMQHCAAREAAAWSEGDADSANLWRMRQRMFLTSHLLPWTSAFRERVGAAHAHPYYRALANLTADFLAADALSLAEAVEDPLQGVEAIP